MHDTKSKQNVEACINDTSIYGVNNIKYQSNGLY